MTISLRESFVEVFGEEQAQRLEEAALFHSTSPFGGQKKPDQGDLFRWTILSCIGWQCISIYRKDHGIDIDPVLFEAWARAHATYLLEAPMEEVDALAAVAGAYRFLTEESTPN